MNRIYRNSVVYFLSQSQATVKFFYHCSPHHVYEMLPEEWEGLPHA